MIIFLAISGQNKNKFEDICGQLNRPSKNYNRCRPIIKIINENICSSGQKTGISFWQLKLGLNY